MKNSRLAPILLAFSLMALVGCQHYHSALAYEGLGPRDSVQTRNKYYVRYQYYNNELVPGNDVYGTIAHVYSKALGSVFTDKPQWFSNKNSKPIDINFVYETDANGAMTDDGAEYIIYEGQTMEDYPIRRAKGLVRYPCTCDKKGEAAFTAEEKKSLDPTLKWWFIDQDNALEVGNEAHAYAIAKKLKELEDDGEIPIQ